MTEIETIARNIVEVEPGFWRAVARSRVSYPEEGNAHCLDIEGGSFWFEHRNRCIVEMMRRYPPAGTVFDVGGGNGFVSLAIQRAGYDSVLVEPGDQGCRNARNRGVRRTICATLQDAGFRKGTIPAVGLFDVLEHIEDDDAFLRNTRELIIDGGKMYLTVPAHGYLWSSDDVRSRHHRRYRLSSLVAKLRFTGFSVIFASYYFWMLPAPIFVCRSLPSRLGLRSEAAWDSAKKDHRGRHGLVANLMKSGLDLEYRLLKKGSRIPFGASCLLVATPQ